MAETVLPSTTPNNGKRATGINAVAASGIASVIHQAAIKKAMAKVYVTFLFSGSRSAKRIMNKLINGARISETCCNRPDLVLKGFVITFFFLFLMTGKLIF